MYTSQNGTQAKEIFCAPEMAKLISRIAWLKNMTLVEKIPLVPQYKLDSVASH